MMRFLAYMAALGLAVLLGSAAQVHASQITVQLSGSDLPIVSCTDGAACDTNPLAGAVTFTAANGALTLSLGGTGSGQPALTGLNMDLAYFLTATAADLGGKTYTIAVSQNELSGSAAGFIAMVDGNQTNSATTAFQAFADANNNLFGTTTSLCSAGPTSVTTVHLTCTSGSFSDTSFSLTEFI